MKTRFLLLFFFMCALLFVNNARAAETEPNNTQAAANTLNLNGSNSGVITAGDIDWYKVTTTGDGALTLTLTSTNGLYTTFELYDTLGTVSLFSTYTSGTLSYAYDGLAKGTYYVKILALYDGQTPAYTIANTLAVPAEANDREPDSTFAQANTLPLNGSATGHIGYYFNNHRDTSDWYKVTTNSDGAIVLTLTSGNGQYVSYDLCDGDGTKRLQTSYTSGTGSYTVDGLAQGTYYVRIYNLYSNGFAPYTLSNTLTLPPYANNTEPDSTVALAKSLPLNDSVQGHIGYYYNNHRDTSDWYRLTTNADGAINLRIVSGNGQYVSYDLYDGDGIIKLGTSYTSGDANYTVDGLAQGTYYIRIYNLYGDGFAPYKLYNSLVTIAQANDTEPNGTLATAVALPQNATLTGHVGYKYLNVRDTADWYRLTTSTNGAIGLTITSANTQYVQFSLYNNDGTLLLHSADYTSGTASYATDGLGKGVYYVKINCLYSDGFAPYTLTDTLYTYNPADTTPNERFAQALTIPVNRTVTGDVGFYFSPKRDTADFWKINYTGTGDMTLTLGLQPTATAGIHYTYFEVYGDTAASPIFSTYTSGNSYVKSFTGLAQGYYYVKVYELYSNDFNPYSLTLAFTQVNIAAVAVRSIRPNVTVCNGNSITYALSQSHSPYGVQLYRNGVRYDSLNVASDSARFNNLPSGIYYATVYGDGATDYAYGTSATTTFLPPTPTGLTTSDIRVHTAQLNWAPFSCVKGYSVQYRLSSATTWTTLSDNNDVAGRYTLTGLMMYTDYTWRVASVDTAQGTALSGAYSDTLKFRTLSDTAIITRTRFTQGTTCNSSSIKYTSTNSANPYTVQLYRNGAVYGSPVSSTDTTLFTNLPTGIYYATATGTGSGGSYGTSGIDTLSPPVPSGLDSMMVTAVSAQVSWTPLSCASYFTIQYRPASSSTWTTLQTTGNVSSYLFAGLTPATLYVWRLASADNANGTLLMSSYSGNDTFMTMQVLPVTLISFTAKPVNNTVQVRWQTANEINSSYFVVQRSTDDGVTFATVGTVQSGAEHQYSFTDNSPVRGKSYYRLRQVDRDGHYTDSKILPVNFIASLLMTLYPNPAATVVTVNLFASGKATLTVYDNHGKAVMQKVVSEGTASQSLNVGSLAAGTYTIVLQQADGSRQSARLLKQ